VDFPAARSRTGGITVMTTERGLPLSLKIDTGELDRAPHLLADEIMALCRLAATRAQVAKRRALLAAGVDPSVLRNLQLANEEDLLIAEESASPHDDDMPGSWMRPV
jgi:hypothetical protein